MQSSDIQPNGFLLIDKPEDWTSHDVVAYLRGALKIKKIGHAGTLDPFATGLLIVAVGREATKKIDAFKNMPKEYVATLKFGATSNTQDRTGTIEESKNFSIPPEENIREAMLSFIGPQLQTPPMFSAKKIKGKKLYELARKGIEVERKPVEISIHDISDITVSESEVTFRVSCSTGTYIRTLCHDIGNALGVGAYCQELRRTNIGDYSVENATLPTYIDRSTYSELLLPAS